MLGDNKDIVNCELWNMCVIGGAYSVLLTHDNWMWWLQDVVAAITQKYHNSDDEIDPDFFSQHNYCQITD